jgi:hypothetical protein
VIYKTLILQLKSRNIYKGGFSFYVKQATRAEEEYISSFFNNIENIVVSILFCMGNMSITLQTWANFVPSVNNETDYYRYCLLGDNEVPVVYCFLFNVEDF